MPDEQATERKEMTYMQTNKGASHKVKSKKPYEAPNFLDMLAYMRPQGSRYQGKFCRRFLEPVFGKPDLHGNYYMVIGDKPQVAFMSHHDTVHRGDGRQVVVIDGDFAKAPPTSSCLGADCTTGVYIMLRMIEAGIEGVYVVHASEEIGCLGAAALVKDFPSWMNHVKYAISFDRMGYSSVITHQTSMRTCSDEFARSLADILDLNYELDDTGVYTDSNEYVDFIPECTNISVGYFSQHTKNERQDLAFLEMLIQSLCSADWSKLVCKRVAGTMEYASYLRKDHKYKNYYNTYGLDDWDDIGDFRRPVSSVDYYDDPWSKEYGNPVKERTGNDLLDIMSIIQRYPAQVAEILQSYGYNYDGLLDDCVDLKEKQERRFRL